MTDPPPITSPARLRVDLNGRFPVMTSDRALVMTDLSSLVSGATEALGGHSLGELLNMEQQATKIASSIQERFDERDADLVLD